MLRALVLDLDGVVFDSVPLKTAVLCELFRPASPARVARLYRAVAGQPRRHALETVWRRLYGGPPAPPLLEVLEREFGRGVAARQASCPFVPGMPGFLERRARTMPLFVASGVPEGELQEVLAARGIAHLFRGAWGAPRTKPEILSALLRTHGWRSEEVLFIGDTRWDLLAARRVGVPFVARAAPGARRQYPGALAVAEDFFALERRWPELQARLGRHARNPVR
jgi:phosphoglycolate phosphatase-like HAD superfamily hydrolase